MTKFAPPLILDLVPSRLLLILLLGGHGLALASLFAARLAIAVRLLLGAAIVISALIYSACHGRRQSPWFIDQLRCSGKGEWSLRTAAGVTRSARLQSAYIHPWALALRFATGRLTARSVIILPDSAPADAVRRLRVYLQTLPDE